MTSHDLKELQSISGYPCVSIFIPTHRTIPDKLQDPIKTKDMVKEVVDRLLKENSKKEVAPLIRTIDDLIRDIDFTKVLDCLAIFVNKDYAAAYILPFHVEENVVINDNFYLRDLIFTFNRSPHFWVLVLYQKQARLFEGTRDSLTEFIDAQNIRAKQEGFPFDWPWEVTSDRVLDSVSIGYKDNNYLTDRQKYIFQQIDDALEKRIKLTGWLCILLSTEDNAAHFKQASKHPDLIVAWATIEAHSPDQDIAKKAWEVIEKYINQEKEQGLKLFEEAIKISHHSMGFKRTWQMGIEGRIKTLIVEEDYKVPGQINPENSELFTIYDKKDAPKICDDLVDPLIENVLSKKGRVIFVNSGDLEDYQHIGAILRY